MLKRIISLFKLSPEQQAFQQRQQDLVAEKKAEILKNLGEQFPENEFEISFLPSLSARKSHKPAKLKFKASIGEFVEKEDLIAHVEFDKSVFDLGINDDGFIVYLHPNPKGVFFGEVFMILVKDEVDEAKRERMIDYFKEDPRF